MSDEKLGYVKIKSEPMGNKTSLQILTILFSLIAALLFIVKIMYFEKKKAKIGQNVKDPFNKMNRNKNNPLPEKPLKKMIMYLMGVVLLSVGFYSSNIFVQRIFFACVLIIIIGICIYVNNNREAVLNSMGAVGSGFKNILKYLSKITFGLFGVLYAIIAYPAKIPGIGPWLASKTGSSNTIASTILKYVIMGCKIFVKLLLGILMLPFVIIGGAFYIVWLILLAIIYPFHFLGSYIYNYFFKKKSPGQSNNDETNTINPIIKNKPGSTNDIDLNINASIKNKPQPATVAADDINDKKMHDLYPKNSQNSG
jgi:hypothetical protein